MFVYSKIFGSSTVPAVSVDVPAVPVVPPKLQLFEDFALAYYPEETNVKATVDELNAGFGPFVLQRLETQATQGKLGCDYGNRCVTVSYTNVLVDYLLSKPMFSTHPSNALNDLAIAKHRTLVNSFVAKRDWLSGNYCPVSNRFTGAPLSFVSRVLAEFTSDANVDLLSRRLATFVDEATKNQVTVVMDAVPTTSDGFVQSDRLVFDFDAAIRQAEQTLAAKLAQEADVARLQAQADTKAAETKMLELAKASFKLEQDTESTKQYAAASPAVMPPLLVSALLPPLLLLLLPLLRIPPTLWFDCNIFVASVSRVIFQMATLEYCKQTTHGLAIL